MRARERNQGALLVGTRFPSLHVPLGCLANRFFIVGSHHEVAHGATLGHMGQHQLQTVAVTEGRRSVQLWPLVIKGQSLGTQDSHPRELGCLRASTLESDSTPISPAPGARASPSLSLFPLL